MNYIVSQFAHPRGPIGRLVGMIMAYENRARNAWAVSLLKVQEADRVLEIGFGPGWAIERVAAVATAGFVAGVEHSQTMVQVATKRNAAVVREGRLVLQQGSALALPYETGSFNKVLVVNSLHHWPERLAGLLEAWRVLMPGGFVVIVEQPRSATSEAGLRELRQELAAQVASAGFRHIHSESKAMQPAASVAVIGAKYTNRNMVCPLW
jgi:ubiquinone/menaquinone biosynthesis C-methylase UbiE